MWTSFVMERHDRQRHYIKLFSPKYIAYGDDWDPNDIMPQLDVDHDFLKEIDCELYRFGRTPGVSSRDIRKRMETPCL